MGGGGPPEKCYPFADWRLEIIAVSSALTRSTTLVVTRFWLPQSKAREQRGRLGKIGEVGSDADDVG